MMHLTPDERDARNAAIKAEYFDNDISMAKLAAKHGISREAIHGIVHEHATIQRRRYKRDVPPGSGDGRRCAAGSKCANDHDGYGALLIRRDNERMCDYRERAHCGSECRPGTPNHAHVDKKPRQIAEWPEGMARSKPFADAEVAPMTYARAPRPDQVGFSATGNAALRCVGG